MGHVPRSLIGTESQIPFQLSSGHTFLSRANHEDGEEPFHKRDMGIVKDRSGSDRVLVAALIALVQVPIFLGLNFRMKGDDLLALASDALQAARPADAFQMLNALFLGVELGDDLEDALVPSHDPYPHFLGI